MNRSISRLSRFAGLWLVLILIATANTSANNIGVKETEKLVPVNDSKILEHFLNEADKLYNADKFTGFSELNEQLSNKHYNVKPSTLQSKTVRSSDSYAVKKSGVLIVGKLYKCPNCPKNHLITASAFVISEDGLCVTNNHVFAKTPKDKNTYLGVFVMDVNGKVYPIEKVLAASTENDVALFKIAVGDNKLSALVLGDESETGDEVSIVSHPDSQFYTYTKGYVSRYYLHPKYKAPRYSITAEFAKGSSGAPVFDDKGQVIGIVSATRSIYYQKGKNLQMVVREVIPVNGLKSLFNKGNKKIQKQGKKIKGCQA